VVPDQSPSDESGDDEWPLPDLTEVEVSHTGSAESLPEATVSTDDLFRVLSNPRNRLVLTYLLLAGRPVPCYELVEYVVAHTDPPEGFSPAEYRGRVSTDLLQNGCPMLDDADLVVFDEKNQIVRETNKTVVALPHLRLALQRAELTGE